MNPLVYLWLFFHINNQFHTRGFFMSVFPFKKAAVTLLLLTAAYFSGSGIHYLFSQPTTVLPASSSSEGNWGLSFQEEGVRPVGNATPSELAKYQAAYADETDEKVIYLTFDAGYENGNLPAILDALKNHQAVGTFFVVGNFLETSPELTKRMVAEGHIVGNHTYHHPDMSKISTKEAFEKELNDVKTLFQSITGSEMAHYYRPPQGKYSTSNLEMAKELGYKTFFWSLAYVDWIQDEQPTKEQAFSKLLSRIHPGAVVFFQYFLQYRIIY